MNSNWYLTFLKKVRKIGVTRLEMLMNQEQYHQECNNKWVKTQKPTLAIARRMIKKGNHGIKNLKVSWNHKPTFCEARGNLGEMFWSSVVRVSADGCRTRNMILTIDKMGKEIR